MAVSGPSEWAIGQAEVVGPLIATHAKNTGDAVRLLATALDAAREYGAATGFRSGRALLERVAAIHPAGCDEPTCPFTAIRAYLRGDA